MALSAEYIRTSLQNLYGESVTTGDIRAWCAMNGTAYATVTKKLEEYKVGRGKWNLEVTKETVEELEVSYNAPAVENLIPQKDDSSVRFGNFADIKKIIESRVFYPTFITVFLVMVKRSLLSRRVPNSDENLSVSTSLLKQMRMTLLVDSVLSTATLYGIMVRSLKHLKEGNPTA